MESPCFSRPQSTASHLFARTRSFHRPTYKRPGVNTRKSAGKPNAEWLVRERTVKSNSEKSSGNLNCFPFLTGLRIKAKSTKCKSAILICLTAFSSDYPPISDLIIKITISLIVIGLKNSYFPLIHLSSCYRTVCYRTPCYRTVCYRTVQ